MRYSELFVKAAELAQTNPDKASELLREAERLSAGTIS